MKSTIKNYMVHLQHEFTYKENTGLVQQPDKIVVRFALTIYPYSLGHDFVLVNMSRADGCPHLHLLNGGIALLLEVPHKKRVKPLDVRGLPW